MIDAYADGRPVPAAFFQKPAELAARHLVVLGEIAGIDADLVGHCGCGDGHLRGEVDVGHQGDGDAHCPEAGLYLPERLHLAEALGGEPDQLRAGLIQAETLLYGSQLHMLCTTVLRASRPMSRLSPIRAVI